MFATLAAVAAVLTWQLYAQRQETKRQLKALQADYRPILELQENNIALQQEVGDELDLTETYGDYIASTNRRSARKIQVGK